MPPPADLLSARALNRATLDRQRLLHRRPGDQVLATVEHLVGLQAQTPHSWYVGLWNRLDGFRPEQLADLLIDRQVVRIALMRSTIHLVTAQDCLALRPLVQPVIERSMKGNFGKRLAGLDPAEVAAAGRELLAEQPLTFSQLGKLLALRWPDRDPAALNQGVRAWVPLVQVPPRGVWGKSGPIAHASAESWLGRSDVPALPVQDLVLRYLAAFGPASVKDVQTWSGLTRLGEVVEQLRPRLRGFLDEQGRELFDLPDAPRPDPDTPAPPRFLYDYDNLLLSHADRSRFITERYFSQGFTMDGPMPSILLVDGVTNGTWKITKRRRAATLTVQPFTRLSIADRAAITEEGAQLLDLVAADAEIRDLRFLPPK